MIKPGPRVEAHAFPLVAPMVLERPDLRRMIPPDQPDRGATVTRRINTVG
jgi:hypothetical protein